MHVRLDPISRLPRGQWGPLIALATWGALVLWLALSASREGSVLGLCLFKRFTGVPCPTCGGTRAVLQAGEGDVLGAWLFNPLLFSGLVVLTVVLALRFVVGRTVSLGLTSQQQRVSWLVLTALLLLNWAYVIRFVG